MILSPKNTRKFVVLGLDGLPYSLAVKLSKKLPNLSKIINNSYAISSEIPDLSPVNWTSFFTAKSPAEHGVYGFTTLNHTTETLSINNFTDVKCETIFDHLAKKDLSSRVINLPNTYPAPQIKGMLISGFVADDIENAVHPKAIIPQIEDINYVLEADTTKGILFPDYLLDQVTKTIQGRLKAIDLFWNDLSWDLFVAVFTETDRLFHFFYPAFEDEKHPLHQKCMQFMRIWDSAIGHILNKFDSLSGEKVLLSFADHGFCSLETEVDLNNFLMREGYFKLKSIPKNEFDTTAIDFNSVAFALDPSRIYINPTHLKKNPHILNEISTKLLNLQYNGQKVIKEVYTKQELYGSSPIGQSPDLVCVANKGFDLKAKIDRLEIFGFFGRAGAHYHEDAFCYTSDNTRLKSVKDTGTMVLDWFGINLSK